MKTYTDDAHVIRSLVAKWLRVKFEHQDRGIIVTPQLKKRIAEMDDFATLPWRECAQQLIADADHSALLVWLLAGHEPLPEPPPLAEAYPVYPWEDQ